MAAFAPHVEVSWGRTIRRVCRCYAVLDNMYDHLPHSHTVEPLFYFINAVLLYSVIMAV